MNRNQRRAIERGNLRAIKGKTIQTTDKSKKYSEIKRKQTISSLLSSIVIGVLVSVIYYYIKR